MAITEDVSTPGATAGTGTYNTITSALFAPPLGSLLVAMVAGEWSRSSITPTISDSRGGTWKLVAIATGTTHGRGVVAIYCQPVTVFQTMTVTAKFVGLGGGRYIDVRVLNGADPVQSAVTGWAQVKSGYSTLNARIGITTTVPGSWVYGISGDGSGNNSFTALSGTTTLGQHVNTVDDAAVASWRYVTGTPGPVTVGGTWSSAGAGNVAAFEVVPLGGVQPSPVMPTFIDGMVPRAADLNALVVNIRNLFAVAGGGQRYAPYVPGGKGAIKPLTVLGVTNPVFGVPPGALTFMVWDTPYVNSDNAWNVLAPSLVQINTPGWYRVHFQVQVTGVDNSNLEAIVIVNGTTASNGVAIANTFGTSCGCSCTVYLTTGALLYCAMTQNGGDYTPVGATQLAVEFLGS